MGLDIEGDAWRGGKEDVGMVGVDGECTSGKNGRRRVVRRGMLKCGSSREMGYSMRTGLGAYMYGDEKCHPKPGNLTKFLKIHHGVLVMLTVSMI